MDPDSPDFTMTYKVPSVYSSVLQIAQAEMTLTLFVNVKELHQQGIMQEYDKDVQTKIEIKLNDGVSQVELEIPVRFKGKKSPPEPEPETEPEEEVKEETKPKEQASNVAVFVPKFNFDVVPPREAKNEPVKIAETKEDKSERTAPQIS